MDEQRQYIRENRKKSTKEKDYYSSVLITQIILLVLLSLLLFFFKGESLKNDYNRIMSKSLTKDDFTALVSLFINAESEDGENEPLTEESTEIETSKDETATEEISGENEEKEAEKENVTEKETTEKETTEKEVSSKKTLTKTVKKSNSADEDETDEGVPSNCTLKELTYSKKFLIPVEGGRYTSYFGFRTNPITGEYGFHTGLDIAASEGTRIRAALNGEVTKIGEDSRAGKYIFLTHSDGVVTFYCHCKEILAPLGAKIRQGETIAFVGSTGWSTGPHVHFEVRKNNIRYDPLKLLENDSKA